MKEAGIGRDQPLIAHDEAAEVPQPGEGPFDDPPPPIPPQLAPILMRRALVSAPRGDHRVNAAPGQPRPQGITVVAPIGNQALGPFARASGLSGAPNRDGVEGRFEERNFRWGRPRGQKTQTH